MFYYTETQRKYIFALMPNLLVQKYYNPTWQSSTLVFITPFMYSFSMVGDTPKLFPIQRISVRLSGYVTSTEPFRITDQESN